MENGAIRVWPLRPRSADAAAASIIEHVGEIRVRDMMIIKKMLQKNHIKRIHTWVN
jgi:hypothetical protein